MASVPLFESFCLAERGLTCLAKAAGLVEKAKLAKVCRLANKRKGKNINNFIF